jgi:hypothetical protein
MKRIGLVILLLLPSCGGSNQEERLSAAFIPPAAQQGQLVSAEQTLPAAMRMIIRTAMLSLVVDNPAQSLPRIVAFVESQGGYSAETKQWRENGQLRASATLRIPADKLSTALNEIRKEAIRVSSESVTGQDVSEEFKDLGAQLNNLRAAESELRTLLTTVRERTQKAAEVLEVYKEMARVRGEVERIQGRMDFLKQMTAMSTIQMELIPDVLSDPFIEAGWRPAAVAITAARSLAAGLKGLGTILIWLVVFVLPMVAVLAAMAFVVRTLLRPIQKWRADHRQSPPQAPA